MQDRIPYTYLIGWRKLNLWYYGRRTAKGCNPNDFFKSYFTSSKLVTKIRSEFGDPDVIKIHKIFVDIESCVLQEEKFLKRVNAAKSHYWLNQTNGDKKFDNSGKVRIHSEETKEKIRTSLLGKRASENTKHKMSISSKKRSKRKPHTIETKLKISKNRTGILKGVSRPKEVVDKLSKYFKGRTHTDAQKISSRNNREIKACPYCGVSSKYNMPRYHFDNCKFKTKVETIDL